MLLKAKKTSAVLHLLHLSASCSSPTQDDISVDFTTALPYTADTAIQPLEQPLTAVYFLKQRSQGACCYKAALSQFCSASLGPAAPVPSHLSLKRRKSIRRLPLLLTLLCEPMHQVKQNHRRDAPEAGHWGQEDTLRAACPCPQGAGTSPAPPPAS